MQLHTKLSCYLQFFWSHKYVCNIQSVPDMVGKWNGGTSFNFLQIFFKNLKKNNFFQKQDLHFFFFFFTKIGTIKIFFKSSSLFRNIFMSCKIAISLLLFVKKKFFRRICWITYIILKYLKHILNSKLESFWPMTLMISLP